MKSPAQSEDDCSGGARQWLKSCDGFRLGS